MPIQQLLFTYGSSGAGVLTLDNRTIILQATSYNNGTSNVLAEIQLFSSGVINFITFASGDFTDQSGEGFYNWITGGSPTLYSVRATSSDVFSGSALNTWIPLSDNPSWVASAITGFVPSTDTFISTLTLELALTENVSNILESGVISVSLTARTFSGEAP